MNKLSFYTLKIVHVKIGKGICTYKIHPSVHVEGRVSHADGGKQVAVQVVIRTSKARPLIVPAINHDSIPDMYKSNTKADKWIICQIKTVFVAYVGNEMPLNGIR